MTNVDLVAKKLVRIDACVRELRSLARLDLLRTDLKEQRFIEHTLQMAIEAAIDVASHIVSDESLGEPSSKHGLFDLLVRAGWLPGEMLPTLHAMVGFRNVVVHEYDEVDLAIVESVVRDRLEDLLTFVAEVRKRLPG